MCASLNIIGTRRVEVHSSQQVLGTKKGSLSGIDPEVPTRKLPARKEEVGLLLRFLFNPTRTLPCNPTKTPTL